MISAKVIQDSINEGTRITTFELEYPRFIHSEVLTHRMFSRNSSSSRAVPVKAMLDSIAKNPATPIYWGQQQPGMQAKTQVPDTAKAFSIWNNAKHSAIEYTQQLVELGLHKQIANRITEPFQNIKTVLTATEFTNWFNLRYHEDAQPEIYELSKHMQEALNMSDPVPLKPEEWHVPYLDRQPGLTMQYASNGEPVTAATARILSVSCCAQVSYRTTNTDITKANLIYERLVGSTPIHASPLEHQATPMRRVKISQALERGITHMTVDSKLWSGNLQGWIQFRQLL